MKAFGQRADSQERILAVFQEDGWPLSIDDPLSPIAGIPEKRRLHDTMQNLNRGQRFPFIHFYGDGTGTGIRWRVSFASDNRATAERH